MLLTTQGTDLVSKLLNMQQLEDEEELAYSSSQQEPGYYYICNEKYFFVETVNLILFLTCRYSSRIICTR